MRDEAYRPAVWLPALLVVLLTSPAAMESLCHGQRPEPRGDSVDRSEEARARVLLDLIEELDADEDGVLQPEEVSDRARPYVRRFARLAGLDASESLSIEALEGAIHQYYETREIRRRRGSRSGTQSSAEAGTPVLGFGPVEGIEPIPGFGEDFESGSPVRTEPEDRQRADERLKQYDANRDGYLDRKEIREGRWYDNPFDFDRNRDGRLNRQELAVRYALRRIREANRGERSSSGSSSSRSSSDERRRQAEEKEEQRRRQRREEEEGRRREYYANRDSWHLAETLMRRYDANHNGGLDPNECANMGIPMTADTNGLGKVDRRELGMWLVERSAKLSRGLPSGVPDWFLLRDANGDGQIAMAEFADEWTEAKAAEFGKYDLNQDGIIMPDECVKALTVPVGRYTSHQLQIIPARRTIFSEIAVQDEVRIADLNVQISITHTHDDALDVFLIGPEEDRIELFTGVGGSDDHFQNTILDDESRVPIVKAKPPFAGRYQPESVMKRQPSLRHFNGKEVTGTWTLVIRAQRSDRSGVLHGWSLIVTPSQDGESQESELD